MDYTAEQINKAFDGLSKIRNRAIQNVNVDEKIKEIITKNGINEEVGTILDNYIYFVLIDLMKKEDFKNNLMKDSGLDEQKCEQIKNDVDELIFEAIDKRIKEIKEDTESVTGANKMEDIPLPPYKDEGAIKEEEIPLPNYKDEEIPAPIYKEETPLKRDIYKETGIEFPKDSFIPEGEKTIIDDEQGIDFINRETEKVMSNNGIDIIGSKLSNPTISAPKTSDYSLPKLNSQKDIYREEI